MTAIFVSYRRLDSAGFAGRLADDLEEILGRDSVFRDINDIMAGERFDIAIEHRLQAVDVVLVVIGPNWWAKKPDGGRRIDESDDFVRLEIAGAIASKKPIIPVLVGGAGMPAPGELPDDLVPLSRLQAIEITDARWDYDLDRLAKALEPALQRSGGTSHGRTMQTRRKIMMISLFILAVGGGGLLFWVINRTPAVSGIWEMPSGSYWTIVQEGSRLDIEETHYESRQVWMRGRGTLSGKTLEVILDPVFDNPHGYQYLCRLKLTEDGRGFSGTRTEIVRNRETLLVLRRR